MKIQPFQFQPSSLPISEVMADWLIIPVIADQSPTPMLQEIDVAWQGELLDLFTSGEFTGKLGELMPLRRTSGIAAKRVLLVGLGQYASITRASLHHATACALKSITTKPLENVVITRLNQSPLSTEAEILAISGGVAQGSIGPGLHKQTPNRFIPTLVQIWSTEALSSELLHRAIVEANAVATARMFVNTPPHELTPETFAQQAMKLGSDHVEVWDQTRLEQERMGAILGVARGSLLPPRFVIINYRIDQTRPTLALVGKGVTFDSGGLSIKTTEQMVDMKCDMAGAAVVLATMQAVLELKPAVNVIGFIPLVENMPSGHAMRLGDVLTARNGKTIEVLNTDAEGRLILADALAYAVEQQVDQIVDLATLTGACMIALGTQIAGLMSNNIAWADQVKTAITRAGERAWPLPMDSDFDELLQSKVADLKNTPQTRYGGASAAGKFLEQFVGKTPWVHLDIAGPAWAERDSAAREAGGTGAYVHSMIELVLQYQPTN